MITHFDALKTLPETSLLSSCALWSSFIFSRLDQCRARAVDWALEADTCHHALQPALCAGLRSSVTHGICIPVEAPAASQTFLNSLLIFIVVW